MSRCQKTATLSILAGVVVWAIYVTFIAGTTAGPDFISAMVSGSVSVKSVSSIEVVEPTSGYMPFSVAEFAKLKRLGRINSQATLERFLSVLLTSQEGHINQNHPATTQLPFLRVNTESGFFWLYCQILEDSNGSILNVSANTRNATNPNGATTYQLLNYSELLAIINAGKFSEPDGAASQSPTIRPDTNQTSTGTDSHRQIGTLGPAGL